MPHSLPPLLPPIPTVITWLASRRDHDQARKLARALVILPALILLALVVSGSLPPDPAAADFHRWSGHALVIAMWLCVAFAVGVVLQSQIRTHPAVAIAHSLLLVFALAVTLLASFTGYIDTSQAAEETKNRFIILHFYALPIAIAVLLCLWPTLFRPNFDHSKQI
jgi:amino acid transporter